MPPCGGISFLKAPPFLWRRFKTPFFLWKAFLLWGCFFYEARTDHSALRYGSRCGAGLWFVGGKKKGNFSHEKRAQICVLSPFFCRNEVLCGSERKKHEILKKWLGVMVAGEGRLWMKVFCLESEMVAGLCQLGLFRSCGVCRSCLQACCRMQGKATRFCRNRLKGGCWSGNSQGSRIQGRSLSS